MSDAGQEPLRLFVALWPDDTTATALSELQAHLRGRIIPYANLHLTLAFLGQRNKEVVPALKDILRHLPSTEIVLNLDRIGYFPRNRIAWAGAHTVPDNLAALRMNLIDAMKARAISFDDEQRSFKPHITLARDAIAPADRDFTPIAWHARQIAIVQSTTGRDGSRYTLLASRSLDRDAIVLDESGNDETDFV